MSRKPNVPCYSLHKPSGLAVVKVKQRSIYLGEYGSDASREAYARVQKICHKENSLAPA